MSAEVTTVSLTGGKPTYLLAEYDSPGQCMKAAEKLRDAGFTRFDTHTPFPVHGMDHAMGMKDSKLGLIVFAAAMTGLTTAVAMITFMNGIDYPIIVGGKPAISIPSMVPVCFELTVLFSAFGTVFGMFGLNRLPQHHHPLFESDRFRAATDDKFFVSVDYRDPKFDFDKTKDLLETASPNHIEIIEDIQS
ncbi:MAG: DUF3341 domain-containing protein [Myxococcales bacterium]|nr:DUF3341 domain-containing protein [Myxococcales bacterium]